MNVHHKNKNTIRNRMVFRLVGKVDLPACGRAVPRLWRATGTPFTTAPLQIHLPNTHTKTKKTSERMSLLFWWGKVDLNHRKHC